MNELVERLTQRIAVIDGYVSAPCSLPKRLVDEKALLTDCIAALQCNAEPVAHIFADDLERFATNETSATCYSVAMGDPSRGSTKELYTSPQAAQAIPDGMCLVSTADLQLVLDQPCITGSMSRVPEYFEAKSRVQSALAASQDKGGERG